ncbi:MAG TPA: LEPR-XLL domain-containing protein [Phycisphaerae bacterium]|nr:LEPR-XLL domain-containing protein [Phycisphaerae bacterium]
MVRLAMQIRSKSSTKSLSRGGLFRRGKRGRLVEGLESRVLMSGTPVVGVHHHAKSGDTAPVDHAPTESWTGCIAGSALPGTALSIDYNTILKATHAKDADGDPITFTITNVSDAGTLTITHNGATAAVVGGTTTVVSGDTLNWTPAVGHAGKRYAFSVTASDGTLAAVNSSALFATVAELPKVQACATHEEAHEAQAGTNAGNGTVTLYRSGDSTQALTVNLSIAGTATMGVNYTLLGPDGNPITSSTPTVTFAAGQKSLKLTVSPIQDNTVDPTLTVTVKVLAGSSSSPAYKADCHVATVRIIDSTPTVHLGAMMTQASSSKPATLYVARTGDATLPLTVNFTTATGTGFGTQGTDYVLKDSTGNLLTNSITVAAGQRYAIIDVFAIDDGATAKLKAKISLTAGSGYTLPTCDLSACVKLIIGASTSTTTTTTPLIGNTQVGLSTSIDTPELLSFSNLVQLAGASLGQAAGPLQLKITAEGDGKLQIIHNGLGSPVAVNVGELVSAGDFLEWTPPSGASSSSGMNAFTLAAHAGTMDSTTTSQFSVVVQSMS